MPHNHTRSFVVAALALLAGLTAGCMTGIEDTEELVEKGGGIEQGYLICEGGTSRHASQAITCPSTGYVSLYTSANHWADFDGVQLDDYTLSRSSCYEIRALDDPNRISNIDVSSYYCWVTLTPRYVEPEPQSTTISLTDGYYYIIGGGRWPCAEGDADCEEQGPWRPSTRVQMSSDETYFTVVEQDGKGPSVYEGDPANGTIVGTLQHGRSFSYVPHESLVQDRLIGDSQVEIRFFRLLPFAAAQ